MEEIVIAIRDFLGQPLGVIGVMFVISATTAINSRQALGWFEGRRFSILVPYNGLNLVGSISLLTNAIIQDEVVWLLLEIYLIGIATKGLIQGIRQRHLRIGGLPQPKKAKPSSREEQTDNKKVKV